MDVCLCENNIMLLATLHSKFCVHYINVGDA